MAKEAAVVPLFLLLIMSFTLGGTLTSTMGQSLVGGKAIIGSSNTVIQRGCPCFNPNNLMNHASIAMNLYYQSKGRNHWNCDFRGSGLIVMTDPSYSNCIYP